MTWYMSFNSYFRTWLYITFSTHSRPKQLSSMERLQLQLVTHHSW